MGLFDKILGTHSQREIKLINPIADKIEGLAEKYAGMNDAELKGMTALLKSRLAAGETLDAILPDAFATVREAATRVIGLRHYRVQLIGGIVLHQGRIAEMKTGEGKTLVATLPAYLNALTGEGVHIVTVNEYLARRDSEWMGKVYRFLGLSVGLIVQGLSSADRRKAYAADITYGTNNEMGFDYLRDNMVLYKENLSQRGHVFAIVDEVDSILIDEARTPLIISGQGEESNELYVKADKFVSSLKKVVVLEHDNKQEFEMYDGDYVVDEKARSATLTESGTKKAEKYFELENLSDPENSEISHHINQAMKANGIMKRDVDYIERDGEIIIVDEFTGRLMFGRRYSDGLHQAIEAKEKVHVKQESKTLATITFQNYFRLYKKLSGMTGTALTEEPEFREIYGLDVIEIPTNKPMIRNDLPDVVYRDEGAKYKAVVEQIVECNRERGQPVLVGTISIEKSEELSGLLKNKGIKHEVLNARHHEREAEIVAQAGVKGAVTIATNMAGRGTDIVLGGNPEFSAKRDMRKEGFSDELISEATGMSDTDDAEILKARERFAELHEKYRSEMRAVADEVRVAGGLFILGTERHESRRIDNQLRGRAGRQGDPGVSRFFISMEDDLMRLFGGDRMTGIADTLGMEDMPLDSKMLSNAIETAQKRVEGRNFDTRKRVLQFDDVMNAQRSIIYTQRRQVLDGENLRDTVVKMIGDVIDDAVASNCVDENRANWDIPAVAAKFRGVFLTPDEADKLTEAGRNSGYSRDELQEYLKERAYAVYAEKEAETGDKIRELERVVLLKVVDSKWMDHIDAMDQLRRGMNLRAYGQHDPVTEYKFEGYEMFDHMVAAIKEDTVRLVYTARIVDESSLKRSQVARATGAGSAAMASAGRAAGNAAAAANAGAEKRQPVRNAAKVGRNDPCPCGSGLKYKKCCGK